MGVAAYGEISKIGSKLFENWNKVLKLFRIEQNCLKIVLDLRAVARAGGLRSWTKLFENWNKVLKLFWTLGLWSEALKAELCLKILECFF